MTTLSKNYLNLRRNRYLTQRQFDVLKYLILGYTAKKIGLALDISYRTVENYVETLKLKLCCNTKSELIEKAIKSCLIKLETI